MKKRFFCANRGSITITLFPTPPNGYLTDMSAGLYVHLPICKSRCIYCDFYSQTEAGLEEDITGAILKEIQITSKLQPRLKTDTIFLGGGTPSCFKSENISRILNQIRSHWSYDPEASAMEISIEVNPDDIVADLPEKYFQAGINRISVGAQSFNDSELGFLGRRHSCRQIYQAIEKIKSAGFANFSLDLIFALPGQTCDQFLHSLKQALALSPPHLSLYCLTIEPETRLFQMKEAGEIPPADEENQAEIFSAALQTLESAGYIQYELSNFALPGYECGHNLNYWKMGEYLGLGPSAHSFLNGKRRANWADVEKYCTALNENRLPVQFEEVLTRKQLAEEYIMLSLRLREGLDLEKYRSLSGQDLLCQREDVIGKLNELGYAEVSGGHLQLTAAGKLVADEIIARLV